MSDNKVLDNEDLENVNGGLGRSFDLTMTCNICGTKQTVRTSQSRYSPGSEHWEHLGYCCSCNASIYFKVPRGPAKFVKEDAEQAN